jgi:prepilin-type N-terminal cleavage/methylation domain-containing protein
MNARRVSLRPDLRRGMTLVEVLVGLVISAIFMAAALQLFSDSQRRFSDGTLRSQVLENTRYPIAWISRDVQTASAVAAAWSSSTTSASVLVLQLPSVGSDGLIIDKTNHSDYVIYRILNGRLQRVVDAKSGISSRADDDRYLSEHIVGLTFAFYDDNDAVLATGFSAAASVEVTVTDRQKGLLREYEESQTSKFKLRNR